MFCNVEWIFCVTRSLTTEVYKMEVGTLSSTLTSKRTRSAISQKRQRLRYQFATLAIILRNDLRNKGADNSFSKVATCKIASHGVATRNPGYLGLQNTFPTRCGEAARYKSTRILRRTYTSFTFYMVLLVLGNTDTLFPSLSPRSPSLSLAPFSLSPCPFSYSLSLASWLTWEQ